MLLTGLFFATRLLCPWDSLGKNAGVCCYALLQGIFLTSRSNLSLSHLLHWQGNSLLLMASDRITSYELEGKTVETMSDFISGGSKITADGDCAMKLKDAYSLEEKL